MNTTPRATQAGEGRISAARLATIETEAEYRKANPALLSEFDWDGVLALVRGYRLATAVADEAVRQATREHGAWCVYCGVTTTHKAGCPVDAYRATAGAREGQNEAAPIE